MADINEIENIIKTAIPDSQVEVLDPMDDGVHLKAIVTSPSFAGKTLLAQHRMVLTPLKKSFNSDYLHALQLVTKPE